MATVKASPKQPPAKKAAAPAHPPVHHVEQVVKSQPVQVEVRVGGRIRFANLVYDPAFDISDGTMTFTCDMEPTWIERPVPEPTRFYAQDDPRDGEKIITRVHSGRRDLVEEEPQTDEVEAETEEL